MKTYVCVTVILALYSAVVSTQKYTSKFDNIDLDEILKNDRVLDNYAECILDKGKCTPEGEELKSHIKEALDNGCAKCSDKHKAGVKKVITFLSKNKPNIWMELEAKFDPNGSYRKKYAEYLKKGSV